MNSETRKPGKEADALDQLTERIIGAAIRVHTESPLAHDPGWEKAGAAGTI